MPVTTIEPWTRRLNVHKGHIGTPADYAHRAIAAIIRDTHEPVLFTCIRLAGQEDCTVARADLDLTGRTIRVRVTGPTSWRAVDLLAAQLRRRLDLTSEPESR